MLAGLLAAMRSNEACAERPQSFRFPRTRQGKVFEDDDVNGLALVACRGAEAHRRLSLER